MGANRAQKSITSWLERKLRLKVSVTKTKVVRPTKSNFLGFTILKSKDGWKCKLTKDRKKRMYDKTRAILCRRQAVANSRLGWYKRSVMYVVNFALIPKYLDIKQRADLDKSTP